MDLQGVGAIAASAVAAVSIPISAIVGRWQMRGSVQTAQATYAAAVDAVKKQAESTHAQWRRDVQRDAYKALVLAAYEMRNIVEGEMAGAVDDGSLTRTPEMEAKLEAVRIALQSAFAVTRLEGSDEAQEAAWQLWSAGVDYLAFAFSADNSSRAMSYLYRKADEEEDSDNTTSTSPQLWRRAKRAFDAVVDRAANPDAARVDPTTEEPKNSETLSMLSLRIRHQKS